MPAKGVQNLAVYTRPLSPKQQKLDPFRYILFVLKVRMDRKLTFIEELNNQLRQYQLQKIIVGEERTARQSLRKEEFEAKETLIELGEANDSSLLEQEPSFQDICRWSRRKDNCETERAHSERSSKITVKRNNLTIDVPGVEGSGRNRCFSSRQIPHLKMVLQKLSTPTNKKNRRTVEDRKVMTSVRRSKAVSIEKDAIFQHQKYNQENIIDEATLSKKIANSTISSRRRPKTNEQRNSENNNPIVYPIVESNKDRSRNKEYQRIKRNGQSHFNVLNPSKGSNLQNMDEMVHEKELLQNLIKNTINQQGIAGGSTSQQNAHLLKQYGNLNYFSNSFKTEARKRGTLANLLV